MVRVSPNRSTSRSCKTRKSFGCSSRGISPISSSNRVPPFANSNLPALGSVAPVKAPRTWPNSSLSRSCFGYRRTIDRDKRLVPAATGFVDEARQQFFPGAALSFHQDVSIGLCRQPGAIQHAHQRRRMAHDFCARWFGSLATAPSSASPAPPPTATARRERLGQVIASAVSHGLHRLCHGAECGQHDDRGRSIRGPHSAHQFQSVAIGHANVGHHQRKTKSVHTCAPPPIAPAAVSTSQPSRSKLAFNAMRMPGSSSTTNTDL